MRDPQRPDEPAAGQTAGGAGKHESHTAADILMTGFVGWLLGKTVLRRLRKGPAQGPHAAQTERKEVEEVKHEHSLAAAREAANVAASFAPHRATSEAPAPAATSVPDDCPCKQKGREADRDLDTPEDRERREPVGIGLAMAAFAASVIGGVGFLISYWAGLSNQMLGGMLSLCFIGLGVMAVVWAHWLTAHKEAVEPREHPSSQKDHDAATATFLTGAAEIKRRRLLAWMAAGGMGLGGAMVLSLLRSLGISPDKSLYTTVWKRGQRLVTIDGRPINADMLKPGTTTIAFPEGDVGKERAQTVLLRVDPALLRLPQQRSQWAPMGYLAYSRVCTHAGCSVAMYEATTHMLMCPCHQSTFNVLNGAQPTGGPAARPLPQLPLYADNEGNLRAGGGFTAPPGPGFWGMPS